MSRENLSGPNNESLSGNLAERPQSRIELAESKYKTAINAREKLFDSLCTEGPEKAARERMRLGLEPHNKIVLDSALEIIEKTSPPLSDKERVAAILGTILHDSGKLEDMKNHHIKGVERGTEILDKLKGQSFEGVALDEEIIKSSLGSIERHMNHPFMIKFFNNGERYPDPVTEVDKVVFNADMMANAGFKNVFFRVINKNFLDADKKWAEDNNTSHLEAMFIDVVFGKKGNEPLGVMGLKDVVLGDAAKEIINEKTENIKAIYGQMKQEGFFENTQKLIFGEDSKYLEEVPPPDKQVLLKKVINEEIEKIGVQKKIPVKELKTYEL